MCVGVTEMVHFLGKTFVIHQVKCILSLAFHSPSVLSLSDGTEVRGQTTAVTSLLDDLKQPCGCF